MSNNDPKHNQPGKQEGNENISQPKKPGNDPDQTPNREVNNPPKADPNKQQPGQK